MIIAVPIALVLILIGYIAYKDQTSSAIIYIVIPITLLVLIYLFSPQIDYWWFSRNPVELDDKLISMLNKINPRYAALNPDEKTEFNNQLFLFTEGRAYSGKGMETDYDSVPYDIKMLISQIPATMTYRRTKKDFKDWERIVLYKHPFPSPRYKFLHTMETFAEDGVVILSLEHVEKAIVQRGAHYEVAWHAYAEAFIKSNPTENYPDLPNDIWEHIERISPQDKRTITNTLGFKEVDAMAVLINLYFNVETAFRRELPEVSDRFDAIFIQKHRNA